MNYYEQALRIIGAYIDNRRAHDVFWFEQDGSFVLGLFGVAGSTARVTSSPNPRRTRLWL